MRPDSSKSDSAGRGKRGRIDSVNKRRACAFSSVASACVVMQVQMPIRGRVRGKQTRSGGELETKRQCQ